MKNFVHQEIRDLIDISKAVGDYPDFIQGGGGNTSVKSDDGQMYIKASGFQLKEVSLEEGFAIVNGKAIAEYFQRVELSNILEQEKASISFIQNQVIEVKDIKKLRPSMETGFHSLLHKYVIHTHSVYSNIINCAENAEQILTQVFPDTAIKPLFIEYCNPGFELSVILDKKKQVYKKTEGKEPQVIFLQNHGLIVSSDDKEEAIKLHEQVNSILKKYFKIENQYPLIGIKQLSEMIYESESSYLFEKFKEHTPSQQFFDRVLFPDQTVFFNGNFNFSETNDLTKKINVNTKTYKITYSTGYKEARTIQEAMVAYFYILEQLTKNNYKPRFINQQAVDRINNMESEQYRKDLLK